MLNPLAFFLFTAFWLIILYLFNSLLAGGMKRIEPKQALLYASTVAMIGVFGEIFLDSTYSFFVGVPLWHYNILPIQHGYTSTYAAVIWAAYGFHLYMLHGTLDSKWSIAKTKHLALIFSLEALLIEALLTLSSLFWFGKLMYYYSPGDLWHVSSFQNIPFYFICGVVIIKSLKRFKKDPIFYTVMSLFLTFVLIILAR